MLDDLCGFCGFPACHSETAGRFVPSVSFENVAVAQRYHTEPLRALINELLGQKI
jgi:hypothetical protein